MGEIFAGRYELADPIGRGGVGAVWRAWDHRRHRYVAAKVLQQSDAHTLLRFVREQALRIDHPHVLAPASWAADDDKVLFTMDLVAGGSLAHLIGDYGPLPPEFVCTLLDQLLSGLAAVHAEDVVHRDIKPANILLEATGIGRPRLRLSDFGISMRKGEPRLTETNYVVGTPGYFAPEQMMGAEPDFTADLFAVGLVALYLLQGAKPDAKALIEHFAAHGTPSAPQDIDEPLWQVIAGLLQPDPEARFRTATGARKALLSAAEMLPEPGPDDELVEVFDQIGPLPPGFGPNGPDTPARAGRHRAGAPHAAHGLPDPHSSHTPTRTGSAPTPLPDPAPASSITPTPTPRPSPTAAPDPASSFPLHAPAPDGSPGGSPVPASGPVPVSHDPTSGPGPMPHDPPPGPGFVPQDPAHPSDSVPHGQVPGPAPHEPNGTPAPPPPPPLGRISPTPAAGGSAPYPADLHGNGPSEGDPSSRLAAHPRSGAHPQPGSSHGVPGQADPPVPPGPPPAAPVPPAYDPTPPAVTPHDVSGTPARPAMSETGSFYLPPPPPSPQPHSVESADSAERWQPHPASHGLTPGTSSEANPGLGMEPGATGGPLPISPSRTPDPHPYPHPHPPSAPEPQQPQQPQQPQATGPSHQRFPGGPHSAPPPHDPPALPPSPSSAPPYRTTEHPPSAPSASGHAQPSAPQYPGSPASRAARTDPAYAQHAPYPQHAHHPPHPADFAAFADPDDFAQADTAARREDQAPTLPYTARAPRVPDPVPDVSALDYEHRPESALERRPGPPPKVTVPVLVLALLCFAVGIWALTQT